MFTSALDKFLRCCARVHPNDAELAAIRDAGSQVRNWDGCADRAESHALAPLVHVNARAAGVVLPASVDAALRALAARHRLAMDIRLRALVEILEALARHGIDALVLKGAALAHMIYPSPGMRPMRDLDLLVDSGRAAAAQAVLLDLGYSAARDHSGAMRDHHHLPCASRAMEGLTVSVEIHVDALSGDTPGRIRRENLTAPPRQFELAAISARTLGHVDMLRHLCHHAFEPAAEVRLISVVDIYAYSVSYAEEIPWKTLASEYPFVINALRCLHYLVPLPGPITGIIGVPTAPLPDGVGCGMRPLTVILAESDTAVARWRALLHPSRWWLHAVYAVPPGESLACVLWLRHPARLLCWLLRRTRAALRR